MENNEPIIYYLTDDVIDQYAKSVVDEYRDINLKVKKENKPYPRSVLDPFIFGSMFADRCNCGRTRQIGKLCTCGSMILDEVQSLSRYAKIELPVYYCASIKFKKLVKFIISHYHLEYDLKYISKTDKVKIFNICQFNYDPESEIITVTDKIDDYTKCSFEGLQRIIMMTDPSLIVEYMAYINSKILVVPLRLRPVQFVNTAEGRKLAFHEITIVYQNIIYAVEKFYKPMEADIQEPKHITLLRGSLRMFIMKATNDLSNLMRTSKENFARTMQSDRIPNSGRCTIIPGPNLRIDEVELPRHLFYEACREEFTSWLQNELKCSKERAEHLVRYEYNTSDIRKAFDLYVEGNGTAQYPGKYCLINRAPTLHEYNIMAMKVHLTEADTMTLPIALCVPFNADYDGDTMAWYALSDKIAPIVVDAMSPKQMFFYKINHEPLFMPTQEVMQGLILATKVRFSDDPIDFDGELDEVAQYRINNKRTFKYQTEISFHGQNTTLGRLMLGRYFDVDMEQYLGGLDKTLTSKNIIPLYDNLANLEDRVERMREIQMFALKIVTITGVTSLSLEEMYSDLGNDIMQQIKAIDESDTLSEREKSAKIRELYAKAVASAGDSVSEEVKQQIQESSRAKMSQLIAITQPHMTTDLKGTVSVGSSTLANGMAQADYERLAVENRAIQDIKVDNVPGGGYFTRQMVYLAAAYIYRDGEEPDNTGIYIEKRRAAGRTDINGNLIEPSDDKSLVKVRSLVTSKFKNAIITKDLIPNKISYKDNSNIGMSLITSLSQGLTQGMLALKHGGSLFVVDDDNALICNKDVSRIEVLDRFVIIHLTEDDKTYKFPKPANWVTNFSATGSYAAGEPIGYAYRSVTPSYKLDCFIALAKANKVKPSKRFEKNYIVKSSCYALEDGIVNYMIGPTGKVRVMVGTTEYPYSENSLYFIPDGAKVKKYQRICSDLIDLDWYLERCKSFEDGYYFFREQLYEMTTGISDELLEFFYRLIIKKNAQGQLVNRGVINSIHESNSFVTEVAFENYKKAFNKLEPKGTPLVDDLFGRSNLPLLLNTQLTKL